MADSTLTSPPAPEGDGVVDLPEGLFRLTVTALRWERVHLTIELLLERLPAAPEGVGAELVQDVPVVEFELVDGKRRYQAAAVPGVDGMYSVPVNVTTFVNRREVPNGTWRIRALIDGMRGPVAEFDGSELGYLDESSRAFLYSGNRAVMTVSFGIAERADRLDRLDFLLRTYHLTRPKAKPKLRTRFKRLRRPRLSHARKQVYANRIYTFVNRWVGVKQGRVLFASDQRLKIEGNLLRVQERMIERGLDKKLDLRYSFRLPRTGGWRTTLRIIYLVATSEIVLLDDYFGLLKSFTMDSRTKVIQLWHAGSGFKSVGYSRFGNLGSPKLWHPHRQYTYAITGSEHLRHVYAEAFGIEEEAVIPTGLPRVDWFLDEERKSRFVEEFFASHPELEGKRLILFAPTFRGRSIYSAFYDYSQIDFDRLYEECGEDTAVLFRMHHFVKEPVPIPKKYKDRLFDFTTFPDGLNLLHVTDVLITDYSSIIYEFSLLDRPMLFFAPDKVNYAATRGFHRDYDDTAPGKVCMTFDEVIEAIRSEDFELEKVAVFRAENFDRIDTGAADRVIDWLILDHSRDELLERQRVHRVGARDPEDEESEEREIAEEDIA